MTSPFALTAKTSDYTVDVVGGSNTPSPRGQRGFVKAFSALLIAVFLGVTGLFAGGSAANAAWVDDAVRGVLCSNIYFNTDPDSVWGGPNTTKGMPKETEGKHGDVKGYEITAYEKYGTSGTNWTVWVGPDESDEMKNEGDMGGRQLVTLAGGDNKLDKWAKMKDGPEEQRVFYNVDESCGDPVNQGWTLAGNFIMTVNGAVVWLTGFVFQTAYETASSVIHQMEDTIVSVVKTLTSALYFELFEVMVMLAALWMGYVGLVQKKSTQMAQGALWMFGAAFLGGLMLANPMAVSNTVNGVVSKVSETAMTTISKTGVGPLSENTSLCAVNDAGNSFAPAGTPNDEKPDPDARGTVRVMQCSLWQNFMYNPWVIGQFGHAEGKADGVDYIKSSGDSPGDYGHISSQTPVLENAGIPEQIYFGDRLVDSNWALLQLDSRVDYPGSDNIQQGKHMLHIASAQTFEDEANPEWKGNRTWAGQSSLNRVTMAIISFVGLIGTAVMIVIISMEIIILQIGLVILALLAPIFALVAVHPGMGRRIALMYVNTIVEMALRRIVLSVMLAVMIAFYAAVIHASQSADWLVTMIMMVAVSIGGILYKNKILQMFSGAVNMGGAGKMDLGDTAADKMLSKAGGLGKYALAGAVAGGTAGIVAAGARKKAAGDMATESVLAKKKAEQEGKGAENGENGEDGTRPGADSTSSMRPAGNPDPSREGNNVPAEDGTRPAPLAEGEVGPDGQPIDGAGYKDGDAYNEGLRPDADAEAAALESLSDEERDAFENGTIPAGMTEEEWNDRLVAVGLRPDANNEDDNSIADEVAGGAAGGAVLGAATLAERDRIMNRPITDGDVNRRLRKMGEGATREDAVAAILASRKAQADRLEKAGDLGAKRQRVENGTVRKGLRRGTNVVGGVKGLPGRGKAAMAAGAKAQAEKLANNKLADAVRAKHAVHKDADGVYAAAAGKLGQRRDLKKADRQDLRSKKANAKELKHFEAINAKAIKTQRKAIMKSDEFKSAWKDERSKTASSLRGQPGHVSVKKTLMRSTTALSPAQQRMRAQRLGKVAGGVALDSTAERRLKGMAPQEALAPRDPQFVDSSAPITAPITIPSSTAPQTAQAAAQAAAPAAAAAAATAAAGLRNTVPQNPGAAGTETLGRYRQAAAARGEQRVPSAPANVPPAPLNVSELSAQEERVPAGAFYQDDTSTPVNNRAAAPAAPAAGRDENAPSVNSRNATPERPAQGRRAAAAPVDAPSVNQGAAPAAPAAGRHSAAAPVAGSTRQQAPAAPAAGVQQSAAPRQESVRQQAPAAPAAGKQEAVKAAPAAREQAPAGPKQEAVKAAPAARQETAKAAPAPRQESVRQQAPAAPAAGKQEAVKAAPAARQETAKTAPAAPKQETVKAAPAAREQAPAASKPAPAARQAPAQAAPAASKPAPAAKQEPVKAAPAARQETVKQAPASKPAPAPREQVRAAKQETVKAAPASKPAPAPREQVRAAKQETVKAAPAAKQEPAKAAPAAKQSPASKPSPAPREQVRAAKKETVKPAPAAKQEPVKVPAREKATPAPKQAVNSQRDNGPKHVADKVDRSAARRAEAGSSAAKHAAEKPSRGLGSLFRSNKDKPSADLRSNRNNLPAAPPKETPGSSHQLPPRPQKD